MWPIFKISNSKIFQSQIVFNRLPDQLHFDSDNSEVDWQKRQLQLIVVFVENWTERYDKIMKNMKLYLFHIVDGLW